MNNHNKIMSLDAWITNFSLLPGLPLCYVLLCKKNSIMMISTTFFLLKNSWATWQLKKIVCKKFEPVFLFAFLNTPLIIFCLIYSLNIPHSNENPSFFSWLNWSFSINQPLLYISAIGEVNTKIILIFLSVWFTIVTGDGIMSGFVINTKYIVCLSFPGSQAKSNWVFRVY